MPDILSERVFDAQDQLRFAALSGDYNPIHVDVIAARRTIAGRTVVHGLHTLLWALDSLAAAYPDLPPPDGLRADFTSFLPVGRTASLGPLEGDTNRRATVSADGLAVMKLELRYGARAAIRCSQPSGAASTAVPEVPIALDLSDMGGRRGELAYATGPLPAKAAFPALSAWIGVARVQALLCCTRLVGMVCPGLHSVFNRVDAAFRDVQTDTSDRLLWEVASVDERFRRVTLSVAAAGFAANLSASVRNPPVIQPSLAAIATHVEADRFRGAKVLVVGGSRGLGEVTAKILAAGGAELIITYARGRDDAERVVAEVDAWGGICRSICYDLEQSPIVQLRSGLSGLTHAYYYATCNIHASVARLFDAGRFRHLCRFYIDGFAELCDALASCEGVRVFYPSSVYVETRPNELIEYCMAKAAGEVLCDAVNQRRGAVRVIANRLPALATDQTATLQAPAALDVLLPIVRQVQTGAAERIV